MVDNLSNSTAELFDCDYMNMVISNGKTISGVSPTGDSGKVVISDIDTQGTLDLFESSGDYIVLSVYGHIPKISYDYFVGDDPVGNILEISPKGGIAATIHYKPIDDSSTGEMNAIIPMTALTGRSLEDIAKTDAPKRIHTVYIGISSYKDPEIDTYRHALVVISGGIMSKVADIPVEQIAYGSLRKRFTIEMSQDTLLMSFFFGRKQLFDPQSGFLADVSEPIMLDTLIGNERDGDRKEALKQTKKMLLHPSKLYNTEGVI
jgi:hypothetical protein